MTKTPTVIAGLKVHPAAEIFPLLEGEDFARLCDDIKSSGLREPIWRVWQDSGLGNGTREAYVLDGRNRLRACERMKVKPDFRDYDGDDAVGFVLSLNLHRRHLDESQRAMVGKRAAVLKRGANQHAQICASSQAEAARLLNVSRGSLQSAGVVLDRGVPELAAAVDRGDVRVSAAATVAKLPQEKQRELVAKGPNAVRKAASEIRHEASEKKKAAKPPPEPAPESEPEDAAADDEYCNAGPGESGDGDSDYVWNEDVESASLGKMICDFVADWPKDRSLAPVARVLEGWVKSVHRIEERRKSES